MSYDIIGDIHGCDQTLRALLEKLGYRVDSGVYRHDTRRAIFLGDFIDRGPGQREVINIVQPMVESGAALSVMGNHEFNAIAYFTKDKYSGDYLRRHSEANETQHKVFLDAYAANPQQYAEVIGWFKTLPLWLDLGDLRVVHACWDSRLIARIENFLHHSSYLNEELIQLSSTAGEWQFVAVEALLKGKEVPLPEGHCIQDKDGNKRHNIRIRWWDPSARTYHSAFMGETSTLTHIPDDEISGDHMVEYSHENPPVFLGHYWMEGEPEPLADNIACLDYSVAKTGGKLVAYRWDGEQIISNDKFVYLERVEV